jgi:type VI secretion system protein ImpH
MATVRRQLALGITSPRSARGPVIERLFAEPRSFTFLQAVRLLEETIRLTPPGETVNPGEEVVRFRHAVHMDCPAHDVESLREDAGAPQPEMQVNVMGLAGANGPLPAAVSELVMERSFRGDKAMASFLDIFNHRLVSLLYRERKKFRPALDRDAPATAPLARVVLALLGLGTPHLQNRMCVKDRSLLLYAGILTDRDRSSEGLVRLLRHYFGVAVHMVPFRGKWQKLDDRDTTRIGAALGRNQLLGKSVVLGQYVWDQQASFELRIGPLTFGQLLSFLPAKYCQRGGLGSANGALRDVIRFYLDEDLGFSYRLLIRKSEIPPLRLGEESHLGWTTWLRGKEAGPASAIDSQVRLVGRE